jgi:hypothetical protein
VKVGRGISRGTSVARQVRNSLASRTIAAGVNAKALSTYMGHANIGITMGRCEHLMPGNEAEAAVLLDSLHRGDRGCRLAHISRLKPSDRVAIAHAGQGVVDPEVLVVAGEHAYRAGAAPGDAEVDDALAALAGDIRLAAPADRRAQARVELEAWLER